MSQLLKLIDSIPQIGKIEWIGVRPARNEPMLSLDVGQVVVGKGLAGDRFNGSANNPRQVTLIQFEHLAVIAACIGKSQLGADQLRRNIVISGLNLLALKDKTFQLGDCLLEMTGLCHPCSKMERSLGPGGYNAMRGHGGITARVVSGGSIRPGDSLIYTPLDIQPSTG